MSSKAHPIVVLFGLAVACVLLKGGVLPAVPLRTQQSVRDKLQDWIAGKMAGAMDWVDTVDTGMIDSLLTGDLLTPEQKAALQLLRDRRPR
jgi:hypothetical protein